jgi:hypothetical protein
MQIPRKNRFLPECDLNQFKGVESQNENDSPKLVKSTEKLTLYLALDRVHLKPRVHIKLMMMLSE